MKVCFKCLRSLDIDLFYRHPMMADGHLGKCKECTKEDVKNNTRNKQEYYKKYDYERTRTETRREANRSSARRYRHRNKAKVAERTYSYRSENRERYMAHCAVSSAVRAGKIRKAPCWICGSAKVHAHHQDYSKPLDIVWLCSVHHAELHSFQDDKKEQ